VRGVQKKIEKKLCTDTFFFSPTLCINANTARRAYNFISYTSALHNKTVSEKGTKPKRFPRSTKQEAINANEADNNFLAVEGKIKIDYFG
jgi:hypothetical protein